MLAAHLSGMLGFDAVHVNTVGLRGASDPDVLAYAVAEDRIVMTSNAVDFRKLARHAAGHPGLAVLLDAVGRQQQITFGTKLANAVDAMIASGGTARGRLFEIDRSARVRDYPLP